MCMKRIEMARLTGIPVALAAAERRAGAAGDSGYWAGEVRALFSNIYHISNAGSVPQTT